LGSRRPKEPQLVVTLVKLMFGARTKVIPSPVLLYLYLYRLYEEFIGRKAKVAEK